MTVINFHIFDKYGNCRFSLEPTKPEKLANMHGLLYSLTKFNHRMAPSHNYEKNDFFYFTNSSYHLVSYEVATSIRFVLLISPDMPKNGSLYYKMMDNAYKVYVQYFVQDPSADI